jgi:translation initiation factor 1
MSTKKRNGLGGLVYSTNPNFMPDDFNEAAPETLPPPAQQLRIILDTKQRGGKAVTIVYGFTGATAALEHLGKSLKTFCGTGGSVKDGDILVQGDNRDKVLQWLHKNGYTAARKL